MYHAVHSHDFTRHINELRNQLAHFLNLLQHESQVLKSNDADSLLELLVKKQETSDTISKLSLDIELQFGLPNRLEDLKAICIEQNLPSLASLIEEITQLSQVCKDTNIRNGITIQAIENINAEMINLFAQPEDSQISLYNASGEKKPSKSKASLGKA